MNVYNTLKQLSLELPPSSLKGEIYQPVEQVGNLLYISGQGATHGGIPVLEGKLGKECSAEQGQKVARIYVLNALSVLHDYLGDLNQVRSLTKTLAFVASANGFNQQPIATNSASQLLKDPYGEDGIGTHSAIGVNELPGSIPIEIEFIFEI